MTGDGNIYVKGNVDHSALNTGDHANVAVSNVTGGEGDEALRRALTEIRAILAELPRVNPRALTRMDEAAEEARKPEPDPGEVVSLVTQATNYAKAANGFADQIQVLRPHLHQLAAWSGQSWDQLAGLLGF